MTGVPVHQKGYLIWFRHLEKCSYCKQQFLHDNRYVVHALNVLEWVCCCLLDWETAQVLRPGSIIPASRC